MTASARFARRDAPHSLRASDFPPRPIGAFLLAWLLCLVPASAQPSTDEPCQVQPILARQVSPGAFEISVTTLVRQPLSVPQVPVVSSYLRFVAPLRLPALLEDNLLGSLYQVDLNDRPGFEEVSVEQRDGVLRVDQLPVEPLSTGEFDAQAPYREDGSPKTFRLDPDGPEMMVLFYTPPVMGLELQHRGYRPTVQDLPNPTLQFMVFEPCVGPTSPVDLPGEPQFSLSVSTPAGQDEPEQHLTFSWEPWLFAREGQPPQWLRTVWVALPLSAQPGQQTSTFRIDCSGDSNPVGVMAQLNYALQPGIRLRTRPVVGPIWTGSAAPPSR